MALEPITEPLRQVDGGLWGLLADIALLVLRFIGWIIDLLSPGMI
jgi:hypothetical protein